MPSGAAVAAESDRSTRRRESPFFLNRRDVIRDFNRQRVSRMWLSVLRMTVADAGHADVNSIDA